MFRALHSGGVGRTGDTAAHTRLGGCEDRSVNDPQFGRVDGLPGVGGIGTRDAPSGVRVFDEAHAVPDDAAIIDRVAQDAGAAPWPAIDDGALPWASARSGDGFGVEAMGYVARRTAGQIFVVDPAHDVGFVVDNDGAAFFARVEVIAVGLAACQQAFADLARHAATRLVRQVFGVHLGDDAAQAQGQAVSRAFVDGDEIDAGEFQAFVNRVQVGLVAGQAVDGFDDDGIEKPGCGVHHEIEQTVAADHGCAGNGGVAVGFDDGVTFAPRIGPRLGFLVSD